jgi:hypothetical protein
MTLLALHAEWGPGLHRSPAVTACFLVHERVHPSMAVAAARVPEDRHHLGESLDGLHLLGE